MTTEEKIRKVFSHNLSKLLKEKNSTQLDLAHFMSVSNTTVNNWVNGYKMPRMDKIDKICLFLGINRTKLLTEPTPLAPPIPTHEPLQLTAHEETHIKKYRQLDDDGKKVVDETMDFQLFKAAERVESKEELLG